MIRVVGNDDARDTIRGSRIHGRIFLHVRLSLAVAINVVEGRRVVEGQPVWACADDGAVDIMEVFDFEFPTPLESTVDEEEVCCCEGWWAWEFAEGVEVDVVYYGATDVEYEGLRWDS
jgi:hypothetical protein